MVSTVKVNKVSENERKEKQQITELTLCLIVACEDRSKDSLDLNSRQLRSQPKSTIYIFANVAITLKEVLLFESPCNVQHVIKCAGECAKAKTLPLVSRYRVLLTDGESNKRDDYMTSFLAGKLLQTVSSGE